MHLTPFILWNEDELIASVRAKDADEARDIFKLFKLKGTHMTKGKEDATKRTKGSSHQDR
jgi:hypothetical protein